MMSQVGVEHSFSDYRYIEFTIIPEGPSAENIKNLRLTTGVTKQKLLTRNLHTPPTYVLNSQKLDSLSQPWWNTTLANLKSECRAIFNRAKFYNSEASWNIYHRKLSLYKK